MRHTFTPSCSRGCLQTPEVVTRKTRLHSELEVLESLQSYVESSNIWKFRPRSSDPFLETTQNTGVILEHSSLPAIVFTKIKKERLKKKKNLTCSLHPSLVQGSNKHTLHRSCITSIYPGLQWSGPKVTA